jgi:serine/threonine protein kinase
MTAETRTTRIPTLFDIPSTGDSGSGGSLSSDASQEGSGGIPKEIAGFRIEKALGAGAYGKVFKAFDPTNKRIVALKLVRCKDESDVFYLQREIAFHQLLKHPNIVQCYDAITIDADTVAMVLEFVPGMELFDKITTQGFLSEKTARALFRQIVSAIGYLQTYFFVHRDLKPENIMVTFDGQVKVMDFGFANLFDVEQRLSSWCGTLNYSSPEIVKMQSYSGPEADVWSLGVVLYTMITGMMAFGGSDAHVVAQQQQILHHSFPKLPSHVSRPLKDLLKRILVLDPAKRLPVAGISEHPWLLSPEFPKPVDFLIAEQRHRIHIRREQDFDSGNAKPDSRISREMKKYWTDRIVYIFKKIDL